MRKADIERGMIRLLPMTQMHDANAYCRRLSPAAVSLNAALQPPFQQPETHQLVNASACSMEL